MEEGLNSLTSDANQNLLIYGVIALVVLIALFILVRMLSSRNAIGGKRRRGARISVVEVQPIDQQRRLILVRRDNVEHLILIGGHSDLVVEHGILTFIPDRDGPATRSRSTKNQPAQEPVMTIPQETPQVETQPSQEAPAVVSDLERINDDLKKLDISVRSTERKETL